MKEAIEISTLPNGIRVVSERVDYVESASIGIWIGSGARYEPSMRSGISHFIEHMLFKGTANRTAKEIAGEIESRGGSINAFTNKEFTCYYARSLAEHTPLTLEILADMIRNPLLEPAEIEREQRVVLEEIRSVNDTPEDLVMDIFERALWQRHPLGRSVLGTNSTIRAVNRETLLQHLQQFYTPDRIVVSAAGLISHPDLVRMVERALGDLPPRQSSNSVTTPRSTSGNKLLKRRIEQVHFVIGYPTFGQHDQRRYALSVLDMVLGGNMSSRLFQEIREKRGLVYHISSYSHLYADVGFFSVIGGTGADTYDTVMDLINVEMTKVVNEGISEDELSKAKTQTRGALILGLESMGTRMMRMGRSILVHNRVIPIQEITDQVECLTRGDIHQVAQELFGNRQYMAARIGPAARVGANQ
ncbi:MAG: insulinase family protein [Armatimonadetes bacterium]|nr:insulinase family protein [Armatimonadota bacterium]